MAEGEPDPHRIDVDRSEGFGERLLGMLIDRAHMMPPQLLAPLIAEEVRRIGSRDVSIMLQDYGQSVLVPLRGRGLAVPPPEPIEGTAAGRAFTHAAIVEQSGPDGTRVFLPLRNGSDEVGVMTVTLDVVDDDDRRLLGRLAGLVADMLVTKNAYTDEFFLARRIQPMSVAAEMQWSLLPPLTMATPRVAVSGQLEPAYDAAGDSFDYALNGHFLHAAIIDAMGHGLDAAVMATVAIGAYRHARRADIPIDDLYRVMDGAIERQFAPDHFVTAQMMRLDVDTGHLQWVNAGHPPAMLIRDRLVVGRLYTEGTLPVGIGGDKPQVNDLCLEPGDRLLCYTDGVTDERMTGHEQFGEERLVEFVEKIEHSTVTVQETVRSLAHALTRARGGRTTDDATLFLIEWRGGTAELLPEVGSAQPV